VHDKYSAELNENKWDCC